MRDSCGVGPRWQAAIGLCMWLESDAGRRMVPLLNRAVVELGAGCGIVGLAAARLGAHTVWLTDGEPPAVTMCAANLAIEAVSPARRADRVRVLGLAEEVGDVSRRAELQGGATQLLWGRASGFVLQRLLASQPPLCGRPSASAWPDSGEGGDGGVVVAADVVYEMAAITPLVESIEAALVGGAHCCVVSYESRAAKADEERVFVDTVTTKFEAHFIVTGSWEEEGAEVKPWWWFDELNIVVLSTAQF